MENNIPPIQLKRLLLLLLFAPAVHFATAQNVTDTAMKSRLIRFVDSAHTLLRTEQINHGHVMTCYIQLYIASDLATGKVVSGLYLADSQGHEAYVDADELPLLLAAMNRISKEILGRPPVNRAAVYFRSRGGFEAGCLEDEKSQWQLFIQLNARDAASLIKIKKSDFEVFVQILTDVQGKL